MINNAAAGAADGPGALQTHPPPAMIPADDVRAGRGQTKGRGGLATIAIVGAGSMGSAMSVPARGADRRKDGVVWQPLRL